MNAQPRSGRAHSADSGCGAGCSTTSHVTPARAMTHSSTVLHAAAAAPIAYIRAFAIIAGAVAVTHT